MRKIKTSKSGYKSNSPDRKEPALRIPSGRITMEDVQFPVWGTDNLGNQILMQPGQEYEFPGDEVTEVPMMQKGGQPTAADSLALYNNAKQVAAYYNKPGYKVTATIPIIYGDIVTEINDLSAKGFSGTASVAGEPFGLKWRKDLKIPMSNYRKDINANQYYQRENADAILDINAPMTLFDKRIKPQSRRSLQYEGPDTLNGNVIGLYEYDPIAIKPYNMLTPQEKIIRDKKYGKSVINKSTLTKPKPVEPQAPKFKRTKSPTNYGININAVDQPQAAAPDVKRAEWDNTQKTKFVATYPNYPNYLQQESIYFPTLGSLQAFAESNNSSASYAGDRSSGQVLLQNKPKFQKGGPAPIVVNNPNDPRLRAYNDSLNLYNYTKGRIKINDSNKSVWEKIPLSEKNKNIYQTEMRDNINKKGFNTINGIKTPTGDFYGVPYDAKIAPAFSMRAKDWKNDEFSFQDVEYKKPVQPVVYQKPQSSIIGVNPPLQGADTNMTPWGPRITDLPKGANPKDYEIRDYSVKGNGMWTYFKKTPPKPKAPVFKRAQSLPINTPNMGGAGQPVGVAPNVQQANWDNTKPTNYSFTAANENYLDQNVIYFPTRGTLDAFISTNTTAAPSQYGEGWARQTGYIKEKKRGGEVKKIMKKGGRFQLGGEESPFDPGTQYFDEFGNPTFPANPRRQSTIQNAPMMESNYPSSGFNPAMTGPMMSPAAQAKAGNIKINDPRSRRKLGLNNLGALNVFNTVLTKIGEDLGNRENEEYNRQMQLLMNQPVTFNPTRTQQYGNPDNYQIGGAVPEDISYMTPVFDTPTLPSGSPAPSSASRAVGSQSYGPVELSSDFTNYAQKASTYLSKKAPHTDITGDMLAQGAQLAYQRYGKVVPIELALAQLQQEGYLAKNAKNRPRRTKNPFNVGNTDPDSRGPGKTTYHQDVQGGINAYYNLIAKSYLKNKTPGQLLENFVNAAGNRYAGDPNYEQSLKKWISQMKFEKGGQYELTDDQIEYLKSEGYEFE